MGRKVQVKGTIRSADATTAVAVSWFEVGSQAPITILADDQLTIETAIMTIAAAGTIEIFFDQGGSPAPTDANSILRHAAGDNGGSSMVWPSGHIIGKKLDTIYGLSSVAGIFSVSLTGLLDRRGV